MTMAEAPERYRKLPGRRRGFVRGSSVWMGSDHLLLVKSVRVREEYKRFHLRDIQAIVVARTPRFAVSTRAAAVALLWLILYLLSRNRFEWVPVVLWSAGAVMLAGWLYACAACSCRCRIYTAVSRDDLPSVYRTWTARKFLDEVSPRVWQAQGVVEGSWAEAIEERVIGPTVEPVPVVTPTADAAPPLTGGQAAKIETLKGRGHTPVSNIFVASLFADALLNLATLHSLTKATQWIWYGLAFIEIAAAAAIFLQYHRGILGTGMQRLAVVTLILMGIVYYARTAMTSVVSASNQLFPDLTALSNIPGYILLREIDAGICVALGIVGVVVAMRGDS